MDHEWSDELRMLRARAYGPAADILDDPAALARLRELEGRAQTPNPAATDAGPAPAAMDADPAAATAATDPAPGLTATDAAPVVAASVSGASATTAVATEDKPGRRRRRIWPWLAAVGGAGLVVGAVLATAIPVLPGNRVAVLATASEAEWNSDLFGPMQDGSVVFEDFRDLTVVEVRNAWGQPESDRSTTCVFVYSDQGMMLTMGCAGEGFPPTASFTVTATASEELRAEFPEGTSLRFVIDESEASVYARRP
ncbi:hypothetical protein MK786_06685 [Microbacterium sp. CFH 31415]|uniref:hypothetical protein n=1 Tax=Microbacterium sp. CFH 31415 TaxID=2921732 RepID=UPI001F147404|nr:hypothetical protein [Microbacterium sp. CFH 31415]MCH6230421.1 hypothetical protein [Microbacterium sp. CFH 31415]